MHHILEQFNTGLPFPEVFPPNFKTEFPTCDHFSFRNLDHFRHVVSKLTQKEDDYCGISYADALRKLLSGESDFGAKEKATIREEVRANLHRRGLITEEVYEAYRYTVDGTTVTVDVGKFAAGEPDCILSPAREYVSFFYELYVSVSYPYYIKNETIRMNCAKMLAAIEELERQHIFIKINMVCPIRRPSSDGSNMFMDIPLFSHKDPKSVDTMSSVINDRLLRKFIFAVMENYYQDKLVDGYGLALTMDGSFNIGGDFDEVEFFEGIRDAVGFQDV